MLVKFKEDTHQYFTEVGDELTSVSSFIKQFVQEKDWTEIAKKNSRNLKKYQGVTRDYKDILKEWETKRILGSQAGTIIHEIKEKELIESNKDKIIHSGFKKGGKGYKISIPLEELKNGHIYPELIIYDFIHKICGQADEVYIKNNRIDIYDTKTDKEISFKAFSSEWTSPEKLLPPVHHLDDCNGNIYALKMSLYMYMLWKATLGKFKPGKLFLRWCPIERDENGIPILYDGVPKIIREEIIEIPYKRNEIKKLLEHGVSKNS